MFAPSAPSQTAAVLHGPKDLRLEPRTVWPPKHDEAQVEILSTGLCGSDRERGFVMSPSAHS
jgi:threonine dehydrogenase-like Zn-dependent dehydrogenase